jgi:hypothetical protein
MRTIIRQKHFFYLFFLPWFLANSVHNAKILKTVREGIKNRQDYLQEGINDQRTVMGLYDVYVEAPACACVAAG